MATVGLEAARRSRTEERILFRRPGTARRLVRRTWVPAGVLATFVFLAAVQAASARPEGAAAVAAASSCTPTGAPADAAPGTLLETCFVDITDEVGAAEMQTALSDAVRYRLRVTGTATVPDYVVDALYCYASTYPDTCTTPQEFQPLTIDGPTFTSGTLETLENQPGQIPYAPDHVYAIEFTGVDGRLSFSARGWRNAEGSGGFEVEIWTAPTEEPGEPRVSITFRVWAGDSFAVFGHSSLVTTSRTSRLEGTTERALYPVTRGGIFLRHVDKRFARQDLKYLLQVLRGTYWKGNVRGVPTQTLKLRVRVVESNDPACKPPVTGRVDLRERADADAVWLELRCGDTARGHGHAWGGTGAQAAIDRVSPGSD